MYSLCLFLNIFAFSALIPGWTVKYNYLYILSTKGLFGDSNLKMLVGLAPVEFTCFIKQEMEGWSRNSLPMEEINYQAE